MLDMRVQIKPMRCIQSVPGKFNYSSQVRVADFLDTSCICHNRAPKFDITLNRRASEDICHSDLKTMLIPAGTIVEERHLESAN